MAQETAVEAANWEAGKRSVTLWENEEQRARVEASERSRGSVAVEWGCWMLVLVVPWVFTRAVYNSFMAPKAAIFRTVVECMVAGVILLDRRRIGLRLRSVAEWRRLPLAVALAVYAVVVALAMVAGREPGVGFWGLYLRWMGALTLWHAVALAALVVTFVRSEAQLIRLLGAIVLGAVPVAVWAIGQRLGLDTQQWQANDDVRLRSISTLGNASLLGSYLVWTLPFTAAWALARRTRPRRVAGIAVAALQMAALVTTNSRGAWLGALAAVLVFAGIWLWLTGQRRWVFAGGTAAAALLMGLLVLNLTPAIGQRVSNPVLRRLTSLRETDPASSGGIRLRYWREVVAGMGESVPVLLLGHGPQSFLAVHSRRYQPIEADLGPLGQYPDSSHNLLLDLVNDAGLLGLGAWMAVLLLAVIAAARALRQARTHARRAVLVAVTAALTGYLVQGQFLFEHVVSLLFWAVVIGLAGCPAVQNPLADVVEVRPAARAPSARRVRQARRRRDAGASKPAPRRSSPTSIASRVAVAVVCLVAVTNWNVRPVLAEWLKMRALQGGAAAAERAGALLAFAARLAPWEAAYADDRANFHAARAVWLRQAQPLDPAAVDAEFRLAEEQLSVAVGLAPADLRWRDAFGVLYQLWAVSDRARVADAERVYEEMMRLSPRRQRPYWLWGDLLLALGRKQEAEARYRQALALDPRVAAAHGAMAMLYERLGRPAEAERFRRSAKALRPNALVIVPHAPPGTAADSTPIP
jgi:tetratricopeptide (TPR) repeat protein